MQNATGSSGFCGSVLHGYSLLWPRRPTRHPLQANRRDTDSELNTNHCFFPSLLKMVQHSILLLPPPLPLPSPLPQLTVTDSFSWWKHSCRTKTCQLLERPGKQRSVCTAHKLCLIEEQCRSVRKAPAQIEVGLTPPPPSTTFPLSPPPPPPPPRLSTGQDTTAERCSGCAVVCKPLVGV